MRVGIVGYGFVGEAVYKMFPNACIYDPRLKSERWVSTKEAINNYCEVVFICVPTPSKKDNSCDTSIVEEVFSWLKVPVAVIRSTIPPGTVEMLKKRHTNTSIVFQPEYIGETAAHPLLDEASSKFVILGGPLAACQYVAKLYQSVYNASVKFMFLSATQAEIVKYMENTAIASMVTLCNEFYNICEAFDVDYNMVREAFLLDPRMSRYFTFVYPNERGFGGKCLPKDLHAIVEASSDKGYDPTFIRSILKSNSLIRGKK